ncbi:MAG: PAS domain-containing protein [Acidobacteriota bacterium]|nr:PAS domain-containing protein [Acidobacteriota bacterium]
MRSLDWSKTPLGPPETWPQTLKTQINICLNSRFAILIWWGPALVMLYNDRYREIIGDKHPVAMGQAGAECWPEIWDMIGPMLRGVFEQGEATWADDLYLPLNRKGYREECFFTFSYSPIRDESGAVVGIFTPVQETTEKVIGERRLRTLSDLAFRASKAKSIEAACKAVGDTLTINPRDIPFAAIYLYEEDGSGSRLACTSGIEIETEVSRPCCRLRGTLLLRERRLQRPRRLCPRGNLDRFPTATGRDLQRLLSPFLCLFQDSPAR